MIVGGTIWDYVHYARSVKEMKTKTVLGGSLADHLLQVTSIR